MRIPTLHNAAVRCAATLSLALTMAWQPLHAQAQYDTGASDKDILIGQTMPYSGPASVYGTVGKLQSAYFKKINDAGGVNGRHIKLISLDDGYQPAKTIEAVRKLVESEQVLFLYSNLGSPTNSAIQRYVNMKKVPHIFHTSGNKKWDDPQNFPWSMAFTPSYFTEGQIYAQHALQQVPDAKIAILFQNDDYGRDYVEGFKAGLGDQAKRIVAEASYEVTDPTITSQINALAASGANVFLNASSPKFAALAIRRAAESGWTPVQYVPFPASSVGGVLKPAGLEASKGLISVGWLKDPTSKQWADDAGVQQYRAFMAQYYPEGDLADNQNTYAYANVLAMVKVLEMAGDKLTRDNLMQQAASLDEVELPILLPGIRLKTSPQDYAPVQSLQPLQFDGQEWQPLGAVMGQAK